jgi:hypothetical protein
LVGHDEARPLEDELAALQEKIRSGGLHLE